MNRGSRRIAIKDVSTAFLQSHKFPVGVKKYMSLKDPLTLRWRYFKQNGPVYGEMSATRRWEDTIAPWYEDIGFERGENEPSAFYEELYDALVLLWTDDNFMDAEEQEIKWIDSQLDHRFKCQDIEWLSPGKELDYIGMQLFQTKTHTRYCLEKYVEMTLKTLGQDSRKHMCPTPISKPVDTDSPKLTGHKAKLFSVAVGCFGWMPNTCRPDISFAHSRLSQHLANPTESAWETVVRCCE